MNALAGLKPVDDQTRRGQIVRQLRDLIVSGQLSPGDRLTEIDLAHRMGVSRAPLREAIRELIDSGLVVSEPYKGLFVRSVTRRDLIELYSLRTALEQFAFREAWGKRTAEALADLRSRNAALTAIVTAGRDPIGAIEVELNLHNWCYELSGHTLLQKTWQKMLPNLQFYFTLHQRAHGRTGPLREAHDIYVELACGDDLPAMLRHLEDHMRQGLETTMSFID